MFVCVRGVFQHLYRTLLVMGPYRDASKYQVYDVITLPYQYTISYWLH